MYNIIITHTPSKLIAWKKGENATSIKHFESKFIVELRKRRSKICHVNAVYFDMVQNIIHHFEPYGPCTNSFKRELITAFVSRYNLSKTPLFISNKKRYQRPEEKNCYTLCDSWLRSIV